MSSQKTEHYQLHQWLPQDDFLRAEFNENFTGIDTALATASRVAVGAYTGDGAESKLIDLGFQPKAVLVMDDSGKMRDGYYCYGGLALPGHPVRLNATLASLTVEETGFRVYYLSNGGTSWKLFTNSNGDTFHYLAFH